MKMIIYTSFPCTVLAGKEKENLDINEHLILESDDSPILIYPNNKKNSFFEIDLNNQSPLYRVIKKEDKILIFLLDGILIENKICHNFNYDGIKSSIEVGNQSAIFSNEKNKKVLKFSSKIENIKIGSFKLINYLSFFNETQEVLIAYNPKKNTLRTFSADKIKIVKDGFSLSKKCFNYDSIEENYFVDEEGLKIKSKSFKMTENQVFPDEITTSKFMSAIKCEDWEGGLSFLDKNLSRKLNAFALKKYMGEISYFYMLDPYSCFAISNGKNKLYEFVVNDNKITDINDN